MIPDPELLRAKEKEGQGLLQMRPLDRDSYVSWSDSTRDVVGDSFGGSSAQVRELIAARRRISVTFDTDPSYYLTQLAANLRRELAVVRKCIGQVGESAPSLTPASRPALPASKTLLASKTLPASGIPRAQEPPAPRKPRLLVVTGKNRAVNQTVLSALESERVVCVSLPADASKLVAETDGDSTGDFAILVVRGSKRDGSANRDLGFAVGFLAGLLGPDRVCILRAEGTEPFFEGSGVQNISLQDPDGWRAKLLAVRRGG